ncbi:MAG: hypothetical protein IKF68_05635 [Erysipelotrichaceae bacterium]|nr:hypothetical protein [Erysipelotrichaceae bacterium]
MYRDIKIKTYLIPLVAILLVTAVFFSYRFFNRDEGLQDRISSSIKDTIMRRALQCYVTEGSYPESLAYLEENYGLMINHRDYRVTYEIFADNLPPEVRVVYKHR